MKELVVITYPNTKKACYFTPLSEGLQESIREGVDRRLIVADTMEISDAQCEELRTCTLERFYEILG